MMYKSVLHNSINYQHNIIIIIIVIVENKFLQPLVLRTKYLCIKQFSQNLGIFCTGREDDDEIIVGSE